MNAKKSELVSNYLQYLPANLQEQEFVGQFLLAFEKILSGLADLPSDDKIITGDSVNPPGLEEIIDRLYLYFNPQETPETFLSWLAGWVALSLRDDWSVEVKRAFIQQIVKLYRWRGTKQGLTAVLKLYLINAGFGDKVEIFDQFDDFPNYFQVQLTLNDRDPEKYWRQARIAKAIIDQEKPAHTYYALKILVPTMEITQRSQFIYPFKLFDNPQTQEFILEVAITPNNASQIPTLPKQLIVQIQGNSTAITPYTPTTSTDNQAFYVKQTIAYQQFLDNLTGFNIQLSNRTDNLFTGTLKVKLYFNLNQVLSSNTLLEQPLNLLPVLKICQQDNTKKIVAGNTIVKPSGMQITKYMWTSPYNFTLFDSPATQKLQLEVIVEISQPPTVTVDLTNKIAVRLQDDFSAFYLLTPETIIENNRIRIKRQLDYQQFLQTLDRLQVTIKNLNNVRVTGKVSVQVTMNINQHPATYQVVNQNFDLAAVATANVLQICRRNDSGAIIGGNTILGTQSSQI